MPFADQMIAGIKLMGLGMGIVFAFLTILVFALKAMSSLIRLRKVSDEDLVAVPGMPVTTAAPVQADTELVAVITAAVERFRTGRNH